MRSSDKKEEFAYFNGKTWSVVSTASSDGADGERDGKFSIETTVYLYKSRGFDFVRMERQEVDYDYAIE